MTFLCRKPIVLYPAITTVLFIELTLLGGLLISVSDSYRDLSAKIAVTLLNILIYPISLALAARVANAENSLGILSQMPAWASLAYWIAIIILTILFYPALGIMLAIIKESMWQTTVDLKNIRKVLIAILVPILLYGAAMGLALLLFP